MNYQLPIAGALPCAALALSLALPLSAAAGGADGEEATHDRRGPFVLVRGGLARA